MPPNLGNSFSPKQKQACSTTSHLFWSLYFDACSRHKTQALSSKNGCSEFDCSSPQPLAMHLTVGLFSNVKGSSEICRLNDDENVYSF